MMNVAIAVAQIQEPDAVDFDLIQAEHHEQEMRNLCTDEIRSSI
jgi:hypothetical protein